ncbi:uncharacterized protein LOC106637261 [Copidosoma floridanum]|uniref:uncharacterized protein LOC106637261 n=1 Tax=Copidosoma floridanum TaxID=29053 RepID=UPI0006C9AA9A|nr:uncharacterized protein LOC106637261 [Copidosoma floridanum]
MSCISRCEFANTVLEILTLKEKIQSTKIANLNLYTKKAADITFPRSIVYWKRGYVDVKSISEDVKSIVDYYKKQYHFMNYSDEDTIHNLKEVMVATIYKNYAVHIDFELSLNSSDILIKFDRKLMSYLIIKTAIEQGPNFGNRTSNESNVEKTIFLKIDEDTESEITNTRLKMIKEVSQNILRTQGFTVQNDVSSKNYVFTTKSTGKNEDNRLHRYLCGVVLNGSRKKEMSLTNQDYAYIVSHKVREINEDRLSDVDDADGEKVAKASIAYEMLSVKPNIPIVINKSDKLDKAIKEAAFILYNNARVSAILNKYNISVKNNEYPEIKPISEFSEFQHVTDDESWDLIYSYLMRYPDLLKSTVPTHVNNNESKLEFHMHHLWSFLSTLSHKFSSYYRRYRILMSNVSVTEKSSSITSERLHLLRALHVIFKNTLSLLNVEEVLNM